MLGLSLFGKVISRLQQIFPERSNFFSNFNIILVGDIQQINPIKDLVIYHQNPTDVYAIIGRKAYVQFSQSAILTLSIRQQNDDAFYHILNRVKYGECTQEDYDVLATRFVSPHEIPVEFNSAQILFYSNADCERHNLSQLGKLHSPENPIAVIPSEGSYKLLKKGRRVSDCPINQKIYLAVGAKISLKVNLSVYHGLTNGASGIIRYIIYYNGRPPAMPDLILVEFDNYVGPTLYENCVPIVPQNFQTDDYNCRWMKNIPINLNYAQTFHKCQGATMSKCIIDLGEKEKSIGMTYVSLSRVKNLNDLCLFYFPYRRLNDVRNNKEFKYRIEEEKRLNSINILK
jgi:hypothetical protein